MLLDNPVRNKKSDLQDEVKSPIIKEPDWHDEDESPKIEAEQKIPSLRAPVKSFMTVNPVVSYPEATIYDAIKIMTDNYFRRLPIVSRGRLQGVLTAMDVLRAIESKGLDALYMPIKKWMTRRAVTISEDSSVAWAIGLMGRKDVGNLIVVPEKGDALRGIFTEKDLLHNFKEFIDSEWEIRQLPPRYYSMRLLSVAREQPMNLVLKEMVKNGVRRVIVYDELQKKILGIVTATDILWFIRHHVEGKEVIDLETTIMQVATTKVISLGDHMTVAGALALMVRKGIGAIPITAPKVGLIGVFTERSLLLLFHEQQQQDTSKKQEYDGEEEE